MPLLPKIQGIILSKIIYRDKDLITNLLLRNGKKVSVLFYGGRGSEKKKSSYLEFGHLIEVDLNYKRNSTDSLFSAKEWSLIWSHQNIRFKYPAFELMTFILEVVNKVTVQASLHDSFELEDKGDEGLFRVTSNTLFYLDHLAQEKVVTSDQLSAIKLLFLVKLLFEMGLAPKTESCLFCEKEAVHLKRVLLLASQGGIACADCVKNQSQDETFHKAQWWGPNEGMLFREAAQIKYRDYRDLAGDSGALAETLFSYFCYQCQFHQKDFKSRNVLI